MSRHAIIAGGSIGGLFAAAMLRKSGWTVDVCERSDVELSGRGAGIVTHPELLDALSYCGAGTKDLGVEVSQRVAFDIDGDVVREIEFPQIVTSWDRVHTLLRRLVPADHHHLNRQVTGYRQDDNGVTVHFADGEDQRADILIGADGFRSSVRAQMHPLVRPVYSGYVVWRTLARESDLPDSIHSRIFDKFSFFLPTGNQIIGYPIAGPDNDLRPGHRRYNFVWYTAVDQDRLADMLTDAGGKTHKMSIPPPHIRSDVLADMFVRARAMLSRPFAEMLDHSDRPFFTPIYDHASPSLADNAVALCGDAAIVARPHVGMGVTKAACDARSLAVMLDQHDNVKQALAAYNEDRCDKGTNAFSRSRQLGRYIFEDDSGGTNADGRNNPNVETIMRDTAVTTS